MILHSGWLWLVSGSRLVSAPGERQLLTRVIVQAKNAGTILPQFHHWRHKKRGAHRWCAPLVTEVVGDYLEAVQRANGDLIIAGLQLPAALQLDVVRLNV